MIKEQCISVTDLRKHATSYLQSLKIPKYIFVNNKPKAVLLDIDIYEKLQKEEDFSYTFDPPISPKQILDEYEKAYGKRIS
jgi:hypothetical protein